jgi:acetoin utilization deacetylase AcuC-like enzyme
MPVVWNSNHVMHDPSGEVWVGVRIPGTETAPRLERILEAVSAAGANPVTAPTHGAEILARVHSDSLVEFLAGAWQAWEEWGYTTDPGADRVIPYVFALPDVAPADVVPRSPAARAGQHAMDTMTLIGPGTWEAALGAASAAAHATDLIIGGEHAVYAAVRPPGHHVGTSFYGGSCYLNNAAVAATRLLAAFGSVAVIDVDAHHGNGTQQIFWDRSDVRYGSVHVDPGEGWFPHYVGFAGETGGAPDSNRNLPLPPGTGDGDWLAAVADLAGFATGASALVVSLGVDAAAADPESPLQVSIAGYARAGEVLGELGLPTVIVQEGGYDLDTIGDLVVAFLTGYEGAQR